MKTMIFLSGFALPEFVSKSFWLFEDYFWKDYNRIFYKSKTPTSDTMVKNELVSLNKLINKFHDVSIIGHSLGAWWATHLACCPQTKINKLALWTPLGIASDFPIFTVSEKMEPITKKTNIHNIGPNKTFVIYAKNDFIVPYKRHAIPLINKFQATSLPLNGGHIWQSDHKKGLIILQDWIKID